MPVLTINPLYDHQFVHGNLEIWQDSINSSNSKAVLDFHSVPRNDGEEVNYDARLIAQHDTGQLQIQFDANLTGGVLIQKGGLTITAGDVIINGSNHIYFNSGHGHGIVWRENTTTYAGEALYVGGYFSGSDDSNYLHIQGSTTGGTSTSWHDIMRLTATSGNLWIKGAGSFGGNLSVSGSATISSTLTVNSTAYITGTLQLDNSSMDRTVSPSAMQYHGIFYRDKNDRRLVNLEYARSTNGTAQLNLYVLQPNTTTDSYAGIIIYRQTDGKVYAQVGNSSISGGILRNIQCRNASSSNVATQYLITNRL